MEELEQKVLEIVKEKHIKSGGNNGSTFGDFEALNLSFKELRDVLQKMHDEKKIVIREGANQRMIMLPK